MTEEAAAIAQPLDFAIAQACESVSHNLNGQRLGRKGRFTRERIIRAAIDLLEGDDDETFTLSAVARKAQLGMSSLYNYFNDLSELMVAVMEPVMAAADATYVETIREYWPDADLHVKCVEFWKAYCEFWYRHSALLHQRNRMSDAGDECMLMHRFGAVQPMMEMLHFQLGLGDGRKPDRNILSMAAVLMTGIERTMTVQTHPNYRKTNAGPINLDGYDLVNPSARLLELAIRDSRNLMRERRN